MNSNHQNWPVRPAPVGYGEGVEVVECRDDLCRVEQGGGGGEPGEEVVNEEEEGEVREFVVE